MNFTGAGGIKNAHDPIIMGKATCGESPNAKTSNVINGSFSAWDEYITVLI